MRSRYDDPVFSAWTTPLPRFRGSDLCTAFAAETTGRRDRLAASRLWTPPPMRRWRNFLLRSFGARLDATAMVYSSVDCVVAGAPRHGASFISRAWGDLLQRRHDHHWPYASVSQRAHLCTGSHDVQDSAFPLVKRPVVIEEDAWVAAEAFVGPGVVVGTGAVLGARAVTAKSLEPWTIYVGNPARPVAPAVKTRRPPTRSADSPSVAWAIDGQVNFSSTAATVFTHRSRLGGGLLRHSCQALGNFGCVNRDVTPGSAEPTSGKWHWSVITTGVAQASASVIAMLKPSCRLGRQKQSASTMAWSFASP